MRVDSLRSATLFCLTLAAAAATAAAGSSLVVVPAREKSVEFGFDLARVRPMALMAYDTTLSADSPVLHVWDARAKQWTPVDLAAYSAGTALKPQPNTVFILGDRPAVVDSLSAKSAWCGDVTGIPTLKFADAINTIDAKLKFTPDEWASLSKAIGLETKDLNAGKERYRKAQGGEPDKQWSADPRNPLLRWFRGKDEKATERMKRQQEAVKAKSAAQPEQGEEPKAQAGDAAAEAPAATPPATTPDAAAPAPAPAPETAVAPPAAPVAPSQPVPVPAPVPLKPALPAAPAMPEDK